MRVLQSAALVIDEGDDDAWPDPMAYEKPGSSFNQIDKAGKILSDNNADWEELGAALRALWNWRAAHSYPLNSLHVTLRRRALRVDPHAITVQRLKRFDSILRKLRRRGTMQMSQMQDIGGCRAIVSNMGQLDALRSLYSSKPLRHELSKTRDYIEDPKDDGYRSVHLMYRFIGSASSLPWNKLRIEIQMRTQLQHAWATAVETVDAFTGEDLKFGAGSPDWRRFFSLVGSVHAIYENSQTVPGTPETHDALRAEVRELEHRLQVINLLSYYAGITRHITGDQAGKDYWYVLALLPEQEQVRIESYPMKLFETAKTRYSDLEQEFQGTRNQAVLVSVASLNELQQAYPNYFADTAHFTSVLAHFLGR